MPSFRLDWPPSVNHLYQPRYNPRAHRIIPGARMLKPEVRAWKDLAIVTIRQTATMAPAGPLALLVIAHPPTARRYDADNLLKITCDSLAAALDFDDSRIESLTVKKRCVVRPRGEILVFLEGMEG